MWQPSSLALHNLWQINAPGMSNRPDEACTLGRGSRVAAEVLCLARRKPAGAQGHCEDCGLWACARDPLKAPLHRLCLHQMVSPFLHKHPTSMLSVSSCWQLFLTATAQRIGHLRHCFCLAVLRWQQRAGACFALACQALHE